MAHGKETPRQKMIGMMYLVLTAMLALNVSKEVLNAFILVDDGLVTTTENFAEKNAGLYDRFNIAYQQNPEKVGDWKDKADEVHARSNDLYNFIYDCKVEILKEKEEDAVGDGEILWNEVKGKDNMDIPAEVMIVRKRGLELKAKIDEHREYLLSMIDDKERYANTVEAIEGILSTEVPEVDLEHGNKKIAHTWENTYFDMLPLASVITILSKMQGDVRNAEAEMLNFLLGQVDAGSIPFNAIRAVVIPNSNYIFKGQQYRAEVFLAAYDSTKMPEVQLSDGTTLDVEEGKGIYTSTPNTIGVRKWGGVIQLEHEGTVISRPFEAEYQVQEPNATISATGMNVFYRGISNPVAISAGGVPETSVQATISSGHNIQKLRAGEYVVKPGSQGDEAVVSVYADVDGTRRLMNRVPFRVFDLPTPDARVAGVRGSEGNLTVGGLAGLQMVEAVADDFVFEVEYQVLSFRVAFQGSGNIWNYSESDSDRFTSEQKAIFRQLRPGQRVMIERIRATGPDGKVRDLNNITITVI
jgi:gliding motility-associated protein GldM